MLLGPPAASNPSALTAKDPRKEEERNAEPSSRPLINRDFLMALYDSGLVVVDPNQVLGNIIRLAGQLEPKKDNTGYDKLFNTYKSTIEDPLICSVLLDRFYEHLKKIIAQVHDLSVKSPVAERTTQLENIQAALNAAYFFICKIAPVTSKHRQDPYQYYILLTYFSLLLGKHTTILASLVAEKALEPEGYLSVYYRLMHNFFAMMQYAEHFENYLKHVITREEKSTEYYLQHVGEQNLWEAYNSQLILYHHYAYISSLYGDALSTERATKRGKDLYFFANNHFSQKTESPDNATHPSFLMWKKITGALNFEKMPTVEPHSVEAHRALEEISACARQVFDKLDQWETILEQKKNSKFKRNPHVKALLEKISTSSDQTNVLYELIKQCQPLCHPEEIMNIITTLENVFLKWKEKYQTAFALPVDFALQTVIAQLVNACQKSREKIQTFLPTKGAASVTHSAPQELTANKEPRRPSIRELKRLAFMEQRKNRKEMLSAQRSPQTTDSENGSPDLEESRMASLKISSTPSEVSPMPEQSAVNSVEAKKEDEEKKRNGGLHFYQLSSKSQPVTFENVEVLPTVVFEEDQEEHTPSKTELNRQKRKLKRERRLQDQLEREKEEKERLVAAEMAKQDELKKQAEKNRQAEERAKKQREKEELVKRETQAQATLPNEARADQLAAAFNKLTISKHEPVPFTQWKNHLIPGVKINLNPMEKELLTALWEEGYWAFSHGGRVRDGLHNLVPFDVDIITNCPPERLREIIRLKFGETCNQNAEQPNCFHFLNFDITCCEQDIRTKLEQSDLSMNMGCADHQGNVYFFLGGYEHLKNKIIHMDKCEERFKADPRCQSRMFRIANQLGASIPSEYVQAMKAHQEGWAKLEWSKFQKQFKDVFLRGIGHINLEFLLKHDLLDKFIPVLKGVSMEDEFTVGWFRQRILDVDLCPAEVRLNEYPLYRALSIFLAPLVAHRLQAGKLDLVGVARSIIEDVCHQHKLSPIPHIDFFQNEIIDAYIHLINAKGSWSRRKLELERQAAADASTNSRQYVPQFKQQSGSSRNGQQSHNKHTSKQRYNKSYNAHN